MPVDTIALGKLSAALRQPMPSGYTWDFGIVLQEAQSEHHCGTVGCAMGLAYQLGLVPPPEGDPTPEEAEIIDYLSEPQFGMKLSDYNRIFMTAYSYGYTFAKVTPVMVADAIDDYIDHLPLGRPEI